MEGSSTAAEGIRLIEQHIIFCFLSLLFPDSTNIQTGKRGEKAALHGVHLSILFYHTSPQSIFFCPLSLFLERAYTYTIMIP